MRAPARGAVFHPLRVARVERLTDDAAAITFEVPDELRGAFDFAPGESLTLRRCVDGVEHRRTYSVCAPAGAAPRIGVREVPGGVFSAWLVHSLAPGEVVEVAEPSGGFRANPGVPGRHLCIAAGSGITPMLSIIASVLANPDSSVTLLYGNRETSSVMFADELSDLKDRYGPRFDLVHVLSREPRDVELLSGRLDAQRLRRLLPLKVALDDLDHAWLCGPHEMTQQARAVLEELGVPADKVHVELFWVDEPPPQLRHPELVVDGVTSDLTVVLDGRSTTTAVPRDRTLLDSARAVRGDVPFACTGGVCGTCRARVLTGEADMVRNYALEPHEVEQQFVLTCQSFPVTPELTLDFDA